MSAASPLWKELVLTQTCSGSISLIASSVIVFFISLSGLTSPYKRIIFGLSVSDICQSFAIVAGPWMVPSHVPQGFWGIGDKLSCQFDGFLFLVGMTAVPMYTFGLCIYYVCKIRGKMTDAQFAQRVERWMHIGIIVSNLALYITALAMDTINSSVNGIVCLSSAYPAGCRQYPDIFGECDPKTRVPARVFTWISTAIIPVLCLIGIIVCLTMIFWQVVMMERIFGDGRSNNNTSAGTGTTNTREVQSNRSPAVVGHTARNNSYLYSTESSELTSQVRSRDSQLPMQSSQIETRISPGDSRGDLEHQRLEDEEMAVHGVVQHLPLRRRTINSRDPEIISRIYKRELITQASCYVLVFCLSNMPFLIVNLLLISGRPAPVAIVRANVIFVPLAGFFNIIVYTRPNVASFRRKHPECSRLQAFWLVLRAGGDAPDEREWHQTSAWRICRWSYPCQKELYEEADQTPPEVIENSNILHQETISNLQIGVASGPSASSLPDSHMGVQHANIFASEMRLTEQRLSGDWSFLSEGKRSESVNIHISTRNPNNNRIESGEETILLRRPQIGLENSISSLPGDRMDLNGKNFDSEVRPIDQGSSGNFSFLNEELSQESSADQSNSKSKSVETPLSPNVSAEDP